MPGARIARLHPWANAPFRPAPTITSQPSNASVGAGSTANFSVTASDALSYQWQEYSGGGGSATVTGTPIVLSLGTSATPGAQSITVPPDAQGVLVFSRNYQGRTLTLSSSFAGSFTSTEDTGDEITGVHYAAVSSTGAQTLTPEWSGAITDGPLFVIAFVKGIDNSSPSNWIRDTDAQANDVIGSAFSLTVDSTANDVVLAFDSQYSSAGANTPANESGWTSLQTTVNNNETGRLRSADTPGSSTTSATTQGTEYRGLAVVSIKGRAWVNVSAGSGGTTSSYTTATTVLGDSGRIYRCLVTGYGGQTASNSATLTVTSGGGGLTISPSLLTRSKTIYGPTLTRGAVSIAPALLTRSKTIIAPTVVPGVVSVAPALLTRIKVAYAPTLTVGSVTVAPPLLTRSKTIYEPVVSQASGAQTVIAPLLTRSKTIYGPTILRGAVTVAPPLLTRSKTLYGPTVTVGALTIVPPLLTRGKTILFPTVSGGEAPASAGGLLLPIIRRRKR